MFIVSELFQIMIVVIRQLVYRFHVFIRWAMIPTYLSSVHWHSQMRYGNLVVGVAPFSSFFLLNFELVADCHLLIKALEANIRRESDPEDTLRHCYLYLPAV